ncbi:MAG: dehydrogenase/reductase SDR family protein 7B [Parvicella sp.]|jgi:dehydrogenase/reductase SDR family protein 7B
MNFKDKVVWITGASSGIGEALAIQISNLGAKVILSSRKDEELNTVASKCKGETMVLTLDLLKSEEFTQKTSDVMQQFGRIDMLINNGGISQRGEASATDITIDRKIMEVNYFGNIALAKSVLPIFQKQKTGSYVVISSLSGKFGFFLRSAYAASKFALVGFYESLRLEEEKNGVQVHLVFPGFIKTNISQNAIDSSGSSHGELDDNQNKGISADECALRIIKGVSKNKRDIFVGGKEMMALKIQRLFPSMFHKIIKKQSAT